MVSDNTDRGHYPGYRARYSQGEEGNSDDGPKRKDHRWYQARFLSSETNFVNMSVMRQMN